MSGCGSSLDESEEIFHHCEQDVVSAWVKRTEFFHHCEEDVVPAWMEVQNTSIIVRRICSSLDGCEYCALLTSRSDVSAEALSQMIVVVSYHAGECEC